MNTKKQLKLRETALPPRFKFREDFEFFRKFTFKERLKIIIGFNLRLPGTIFMEHSPGKTQHVLEAHTTTKVRADDKSIEIGLLKKLWLAGKTLVLLVAKRFKKTKLTAPAKQA